MPVLLKMVGLAAVFGSSTLLGFTQSDKLKKRRQKLSRLTRATSEFSERVRNGTEELERLISLCYSEDVVRQENGNFAVSEKWLARSDAALMREFLRDVGMSDGDREYERGKLYTALLSKNLSEAEKDVRERCRLFQSVGILGGLFLCIFLL